MPPRYAYWTILIGDEPTSFRAGAQEDLMPTFKRLQQKHPSAKMMWFQNGKLWPSRLDAQEAMHARGEMGRRGDERQGGFRSRQAGSRTPEPGSRQAKPEKLEWTPKASRPQDLRTPRPQDLSRPQPPKTSGSSKLDWQPKGSAPRGDRPGWKKPDDRRPAWTGKPSFKRDDRGSTGRGERRPFRPSAPRGSKPARTEKLEWRPKGEAARPKTSRPQDPKTPGPQAPRTPGSAKRKWVPKEEYKRSQGIEAKKDKNWRPGGEHKDPRQKYKDAKKAKWTRFKQTVRKRWESKPGKKKQK